MALIDVQDLRVSFSTEDGELDAVRGVSFGVDRGKTLAIVGESGSGKSVSTQTIVGLTQAARVEGGPASRVATSSPCRTPSSAASGGPASA